jgi:hypothetical protein
MYQKKAGWGEVKLQFRRSLRNVGTLVPTYFY